MKKVLFIFALMLAFGVSMSNASTDVVVADENNITVVADNADDNNVAPEGEEAKKESKDAKAAKSEGCATAKSAGCAEKAASECGDKK